MKVLTFLPCFAALLGCSAYAPTALRTGQSLDEVTRLMGPSTASYALPQGGKRLEYARGPYGRHTYMVDLDGSGKVVRWEQVLTEKNFLEITPGMSREDLLMRYGHPGSITPISRQQLQVWNYRYPTNDCLWFQVSVANAGRVTDAGYGIDPRCDAPSERSAGTP